MARCCKPSDSTIAPGLLALAARKAAFACGLSELSTARADPAKTVANAAARMASRIIRKSPLAAPDLAVSNNRATHGFKEHQGLTSKPWQFPDLSWRSAR